MLSTDMTQDDDDDDDDVGKDSHARGMNPWLNVGEMWLRLRS